MAILFFDGFEQYDTALSGEFLRSAASPAWSNDGGSLSSTTRYSYGKSFAPQTSTQSIDLSLGAQYTTIVAGMAFMGTGAYGNTNLIVFKSGSIHNVNLHLNASGFIEVRRSSGGTVLATGTTPISAGNWYYVEAKAFFSETVGTVEVRVNGVVDSTVTGVDTVGVSGAAYCDIVLFSSPFGTTRFLDDIYVDSANFQGEVLVITNFPNGAGSTTQMTPSAGSNYENVDEAPADGDTTYNTGSPASSHRDLYAMDGLSVASSVTVGSILAVQQGALCRKTDVGEAGVQLVMKSGATTTAGSRAAAQTAYSYHRRLHLTDPNTGAAWLKADYELIEAGLETVV